MASRDVSEAQLSEIVARQFPWPLRGFVGVVERANHRVVCYGSGATPNESAITGESVFEIGSITKVFTALVLTELVQRKAVNFSDPVQQFLPSEVRLPQRNGDDITLGHLLNHTSGLPRVPSNLRFADAQDPYADYSVEHLYEFLSEYRLPRNIGARFEYSNLGYGLLGHVLERIVGTDYESLMRAAILDPLEMPDTVVNVRSELKERLVVGRDASGNPIKLWDLGVLVGAGGLKSTGLDLLTFLTANLDPGHTSIGAALRRMRKMRSAQDSDDVIGWRTLTLDRAFSSADRHVVIANGGTGGYAAFTGFDPNEGIGVVVLANASPAVALEIVDGLGLHILDERFPLC